MRPRFVGPFEILERVGDLAYRLALPPEFAVVHNVFHVSMLRKYVFDPNHVVNFTTLDINSDFTYEEKPMAILDKKVLRLRNKDVVLVKVQWSRHGVDEATWEK